MKFHSVVHHLHQDNVNKKIGLLGLIEMIRVDMEILKLYLNY